MEPQQRRIPLPESPLTTKPRAGGGDLTPESPELRTLNLRKHLKENKLPVATQRDLCVEKDPFDSPRMPMMSAKKSQVILAASARKSNRASAEGSFEARDEESAAPITDSSSSPGSPVPPKLRTMKL